MDISYIGLLLGLLPVLLPVYFFHRYRVGMAGSTLVAVVRMVVQLFLIGIYLKYLFAWNNALVNVLWVLVMTVVAASTGTERTGMRRRLMLLPLVISLLTAGLLTGFYFFLFVLQLDNPFDARYFIPTMGILLGNMLGVNVTGLNVYYDGLRSGQQLYAYLLGNGASRNEAVGLFVRDALHKAFAPTVANMAVMGLVALPGTMIGQILGGSSPDIAVKYQIMIVVITFTASMLSLMLTIHLSHRRIFDGFGRLKDDVRR